MSTLPLSERARTMLARPNPAVMGCTRGDGQPVTVATWYLLEDDDRILINLDGGRRRLEYLRADPRVSLTVLDGANWGTTCSVQGRVVDLEDDPELVGIDRLSTHYLSIPYPNRDSPRVSGHIQVDAWSSWHL
ncbi:PPOX class probable F420-dependent enzyme [Nakamurella sp. UYEF19]|uniref:pyridoxamine 5'-phosphate oxidase family protein n=1 Tax=Nakamurella sp. UYEF19 TaxID=1756392 RepID=UPI003398C6E5